MLARLRTRLSLRNEPLRDARLLQLALSFLLSGLVFSLVEAFTIGKLTAPALGLMVIGVALTPIGAFALLLSQWMADDDPATGDDGFGGDDGGDGDGDPLPSGGGLEIDWELFEREFQAYAQTVSDDALIPA